LLSISISSAATVAIERDRHATDGNHAAMGAELGMTERRNPPTPPRRAGEAQYRGAPSGLKTRLSTAVAQYAKTARGL
jgi:hypothetical protein